MIRRAEEKPRSPTGTPVSNKVVMTSTGLYVLALAGLVLGSGVAGATPGSELLEEARKEAPWIRDIRWYATLRLSASQLQ